MTDLEAALGYAFTDPALLEEALTHRSFVEERHPGGHAPLHTAHDRLALLGDAWIKLVVLRQLLGEAPTALAGDITRKLAPLVSNEAMHGPARHLKLLSHLRLGRGAAQNAATDTKLLATTFEAVIGAMVEDGATPAAQALVERLLEDRHWLPAEEGRDPVIVFGEWYQRHFKGSYPKPEPLRWGPDHAPTFTYTVDLSLHGIAVEAEGSHHNKQLAWRETARLLVEALRAEGHILR